ncbi:coiled-coil domain-containing protein 170-like [Rhinophrynus dorsalis]
MQMDYPARRTFELPTTRGYHFCTSPGELATVYQPRQGAVLSLAQDKELSNPLDWTAKGLELEGTVKRLTGSAQLPRRYGGDPDGCCGFLNQELVPYAFPNERSKVGFLTSLLTGRALAQANPLWETNEPIVHNFAEFMISFKHVFDRPGRVVLASKHLMTLRQGARTVADYAIEFRTQAGEVDWNNEALMAVFFQGLCDTMKDEIAARDLPNELDRLIEFCILMDTRIRERPSFKEYLRWLSGKGSSHYANPPYPPRPHRFVVDYAEPMQVDAVVRGRPAVVEQGRRQLDEVPPHVSDPPYPPSPPLPPDLDSEGGEPRMVGATRLSRHFPDYGYPDSLDESKIPSNPDVEFVASKDKLTHYRRAAESAHSEYAALLVKNSGLQDEVSELKTRLSTKETLVREMKRDLDNYKENNARQLSQIQSLKDRIKELEQMSLSINSGKVETDAEIYSFRRENKELNERIRELENRVRIHLIEREKAEQKASSLEKKMQESIRKLCSSLNLDVEQEEDPLSVLLTKVEKLINEYFLQKSKISSLEDAFNGQQMEFKASRDTIVKLVSETDKHKKAASGFVTEIKALKKERDEAMVAKKNAEREKEILLEKLKDNHKERGSFQRELVEKEKQINELDRTWRTSDYEAKASHSLHQSFITQLATLLSNGFLAVPRTEEAIKERIQEISSSEQKWKLNNEDLQEKVLNLTKQLEQQRDLYHESASKLYKAEESLQEHQHSIKHLKGKLASEEMIKEGFNMERKKLKKFLQQMAEKLNVNQDISSESLSSQYDMLLSKVEELSTGHRGSTTENKTLIYNLQKKLTSQAEKIELKSSKIEQLEKQIKRLEKEREQQLFLSAENSESLTAQKLQKKVEKLQGQLSDMKIANQNLTAQLVDMSDLKERTNQQKKTIEELSRSLEKLEKIKDKAAKKVVSLKSELDYSEHESRGDKARCQHMVDAVTNELHTAKRALEEVARREKQHVDFRETITRMMGFNINTLAVPDHEIFTQLKRILHTHGPVNNGTMERSKLPYGFRTGDSEQEYTVQHVNSYKNPGF